MLFQVIVLPCLFAPKIKDKWRFSMIKRVLNFILILIVVVTMSAGCDSDRTRSSSTNKPGNSLNEDDNKIKVTTTIFPQYDFVREIAGDKVELSMLLKPGAESHSYEPTPQDIIEIQKSDVFIYVGGESDEWVNEILESMDTSDMKIISLMDCVETVEEEIVEGMEEEHEEEHEEETGEEHQEDSKKEDEEDHHETEEIEYDEHVWTSPQNAIRLVEDITNSLCEIDKTNKEIYKQNSKRYIDKLSDLDQDFQKVVSSGKRKTIVFGDRFPLRYFADAYGLKYYAAFPGCSTETEASAATVAFLIDKVKEEQIPVVFHIELSNEKMADTICEATGAKKGVFQSYHNISKDDFEKGVTLLDMMEENVESLKEALN